MTGEPRICNSCDQTLVGFYHICPIDGPVVDYEGIRRAAYSIATPVERSRDETGLRMFLEARADLFPVIPMLLAEYDSLAAPSDTGREREHGEG